MPSIYYRKNTDNNYDNELWYWDVHSVMYLCMQAYYGGEANCAEQLAASDDYDPTELVCPSCANVGGSALQVNALSSSIQ